jgi:CheY-like chemotaxis protein
LPVLVVDDNSTNRKILEEMIANWRMKPVAAPSGPAAIEALRRAHQSGTPFRLVLLDGHMPEMDGFEVAARVKQDPQLHGAQVILLTSAGRSEDVARAKAVGVAAALSKPVKQSELWDAIVSALHVPGRQKVRPSSARTRTRAARQPLRVLLAEDNPVNQEVAVQMLERRGHSVIVAENGRQALTAIERHKFDLVLMDVQMPEMGGLEATQLIREKEKSTGGHLPIVAMTAHAMPGDRERCIAAGMDGYLAKPIDPKSFLQTAEGISQQVAESEAGRDGPKTREASADGSGDGRRALDATALLEWFSGNRKLLRTIVKTFHDDCPRMMARIRSALAANDANLLADGAHALKGSVGNFGPTAALDTIREMEKIARQGKLDGAWELYATLEDEIALLLPALHAIGAQKRPLRRTGRSHHAPGRKR